MGFIKLAHGDLDNAIKAIGSDWMLITVKDNKTGKVNAMTASWGAMGVLWNKSICVCFVRPERYSYELLCENKELSIAFLPETYRDAYKICGRESGRDQDKLGKCGLNIIGLDGIPCIAEAQTVLGCRVLYEDDLKAANFLDRSLLKNYENGGYHRVYVCEIKEAYGRE